MIDEEKTGARRIVGDILFCLALAIALSSPLSIGLLELAKVDGRLILLIVCGAFVLFLGAGIKISTGKWLL